MKKVAIVMVLGLAACGADGEPVTPVARADISLSESGLHTATQVGVRKGGLSVSLGF
ncbi:MAG: hypothetical protein HRU30_21025 [Rhodobacteraceae bacterium]|nr:hypothetical protein [Paracoccaceae bacterium]